MSYLRSDVEKATQLYRKANAFPTVVDAKIMNSGLEIGETRICAQWSEKNIDRGEITQFLQFTGVIPSDKSTCTALPLPVIDISSEAMSILCDSEHYRYVIREVEINKKEKQFLEIWESYKLKKQFDLTSYELHGDVITEGEFRSFEHDSTHAHVFYIAKVKPSKAEPYHLKSEERTEKREMNSEYAYIPNYGEQMNGIYDTSLALLDLSSGEMKIISDDRITPLYCVKEALWSHDGVFIYGTVVKKNPPLGLKYCTNRECRIFKVNPFTRKFQFEFLSTSDLSARSPRLAPNGRTLVYLARPVGGTHDGCLSILSVDVVARETIIVVPLIGEPCPSTGFPGIYTQNLPKRCFSKDSKLLYFSSVIQNKIKSYFVRLSQNAIVKVKDDEEFGSITILDVHQNRLLAVVSSLKEPPQLRISTDLNGRFWYGVLQFPPRLPELDDFVVRHLDLYSTHLLIDDYDETETDPKKKFSIMYFGPNYEKKEMIQDRPVVLFPHGGPHSAFTDSFSADIACLVSAGFSVIAVNYRGSLGVGDDNVYALPSQIGLMDVEDCLSALKWYFAKGTKTDKVVIYGGSHGGYLAAQLLIAAGNYFKAAAVRNPVTNLPALYGCSDIPDWALVESGILTRESKFEYGTTLSEGQITLLLRMSPSYKADKITTPTLFLLGKKDLRVPCSQGLELFHTLKYKNHAHTRAFLYDDTHAITKLKNNMDAMVNTLLWFWGYVGMIEYSPSALVLSPSEVEQKAKEERKKSKDEGKALIIELQAGPSLPQSAAS